MSDTPEKREKLTAEKAVPRPSGKVINLMEELRRMLGESPSAEAAASLYETDTVLWSEMQAELLQQAAAGRQPVGIDWTNIIEEIDSVGRSQVNSVEGLLLQVLVHEFKALLWPDTSYVEGWRNEALLFQAQAAGQFLPSMRQRIDVEKLVNRAVRAVPKTIDGNRSIAPPKALSLHAQDRVQAWIADPDDSMISLEDLEPSLREFVRGV